MNGDDHLDPCGCCGDEVPDPEVHNRPGLPALRYRVGTHARFLRRMLARLPSYSPHEDGAARPLAALTTRASDDASLALLDAWAVTADVLTFYQERIANEGYLRTATERRSVLELARTIGYELRPGVAASTYLAFTVEEAPGSSQEAVVPKGTRVQSVPAQDQLPQPFETSDEITARKEWNRLRPRLTQPQVLVIHEGDLYLEGLGGAREKARQIYLAGAHTGLKPGERLVIALPQGAAVATFTRRIRGVSYEAEQDRTRVELAPAPAPVVPPFVRWLLPIAEPFLPARPLPFSSSAVSTHVFARSWQERTLQPFLKLHGWSDRELMRVAATSLAAVRRPPPSASASGEAETGVFWLRTRVGVFGHNAPEYAALPKPAGLSKRRAYGLDWDTNGREIWKDPRGDRYHSDADVFLERAVPGLVSSSWAVLEQSSGEATPYRVRQVNERTVTGFTLSARSTGLKLGKAATGEGLNDATDKPPGYKVRETTVHVQSERVPLAELPILENIAAGTSALMLDGLVLGLAAGQPVVITGEREDAAGLTGTEVLILSDISHDGAFTSLHFESGLRHPYIRSTVAINANVVEATHGETVAETLGGGDPTRPNQRFALRKPPLTYLSSSDPSGARSTLDVRVEGVLWEEVRSLYPLGPTDQCYVTRIEDDGTTAVIFGDGRRGALPPSGQENITATYRSGIGPAGEVDAGALTLLQRRPLGIRAVTNPRPATGAGAPQTRDAARVNAPLTVLTFDRIVSLRDYEDFARGFAGIGKAQAVNLWNGEARLVHLTIASATGRQIDVESDLYDNLKTAIQRSHNRVETFMVQSFQPLEFNVSAGILVDPRHETERVIERVEEALRHAFSFERRAFGEHVTAADVVTVIQSVAGVVATDLDALYLVTDAPAAPPTLATRLRAETVRWAGAHILPGQLLLINPFGITLTARAL